MKKAAVGPGGPHRKGSTLRVLLPRGQARIQWGQKNQRGTAHLSVPAALARLVGPDRVFSVQLTEEGILYRYVEGGEPVALPAWLLGSERSET